MKTAGRQTNGTKYFRRCEFPKTRYFALALCCTKKIRKNPAFASAITFLDQLSRHDFHHMVLAENA